MDGQWPMPRLVKVSNYVVLCINYHVNTMQHSHFVVLVFCNEQTNNNNMG